MIAVVDIGTGNLRSVLEALRRIGAPAKPATLANDLMSARAIILPGVGAFGEGMHRLHMQRLAEPIRHAARAGMPVLGVCLGLQLLADTGFEHGRCDGLGLIGGEVVPLVPDVHCKRVPNMGWRAIEVHRPGTLLDDRDHREHFFFAHGYHLVPNQQSDIVATMDGGAVACIERDNVMGVQFHPEKSQDAGLNVLARFAALAGVGRWAGGLGEPRAVA